MRIVITMCILLLNTSTQAYKLEICILPLADAVQNNIAKILLKNLGSLYHVFVRANDGVHSSGLNFEPKNKFMFFKSKAMLGMQDYPDAKCKTLLETHDKKYFLDKYSALKQSYELLAQDNLYEVFNTNCLWATEKVLEDNNYKFPEEFYKILAKN